MNIVKESLSLILATVMICAGALHFLAPRPFIKIVPKYLPFPTSLVYISGFFEILLGIGLVNSKSRAFSAWSLIILFIAVFPANINMAVNRISFSRKPIPNFILWLRLPVQFFLIFLAWTLT